MSDSEKQIIIPAIIPQSPEHLIESLEKVMSFAHSVQIDIVDGQLVPPLSWPYRGEASPLDMKPMIDGFDVEVDLMIEEPEKTAELYLKAGAKRMVIHLESTEHMDVILALKKAYDFELGLSVLNDTDLEALAPYIGQIDYVQLMGIAQIGSQGAPFDERVLDRIRSLKAAYPTLAVSIDGSVNAETLPLLKEAGAERFAVGSAIMSAEDPHAAYKKLAQLAV